MAECNTCFKVHRSLMSAMEAQESEQKRKATGKEIIEGAVTGLLGGLTVAAAETLAANYVLKELGSKKGVVPLGDFALLGTIGAAEGALIKAVRPQTSVPAVYAASLGTNAVVATALFFV